MSKSELRQSVLKARRMMSPDEISSLSTFIRKNLEALPEYKRARLLAAYSALPDEVQTASIVQGAMESGKRVALPAVEKSGALVFFEVIDMTLLAPGKYGISEPIHREIPVPLSSTDVVLVPLVAWDNRGHRIGYGQGYFDRALANRGDSAAIGLGFESQLVDRVEAIRTDVPLDMVVTEKRVVRFSRRSR